MNKLTLLATSLISAGVASLVTAYAVEKHYIKLTDERVNALVEESLEFLNSDAVKYVEKDIEATLKTYALGEEGNEDASVDEPPAVRNEDGAKNQRIRYDKVIHKEKYTAEDAPSPIEAVAYLEAITTDEFMENESGYLQSSITYHPDGQALDEHGEIVVDFQDLIGVGVPPFGVKSGEPHIVYMRNNRLRREIEVVRDETPAEEILTAPGLAP